MSRKFSTFPIATETGAELFADVSFARVIEVQQWLAKRKRKPAAGTLLADAADYLRLAVKRWSYYRREGFAPRDFRDAQRRITADPDSELGFLLVARVRAPKAAHPLGFCFARRMWTGRFVVDFLSIHPAVFDPEQDRPKLAGIGSGLLASLAKLTLALGGDGMWGEATRNSNGFYENLRQKVSRTKAGPPVRDHFCFNAENLRRLAGWYLLPETH